MKKILKSGSRLLKQLSLPTYYKFKYKRVMGYWPNFKNPQLLSEKIVWLNLYYYPNYDLAIELGDKNGLRERYENSKISRYLPPVIGTYDYVEDIDFDTLPNKFVVKKSSASNMNAIVTDKDSIDIFTLKRKINEWMLIDYGELTGEHHYSKMNSKIIVEEFIDGIEAEYQLFCFNGVPKFSRMMIYNMVKNSYSDFFDHKEVSNRITLETSVLLKKKPDIELIIKSIMPDIKEIPLVRVDIIETKDKIYLGELTFTPAGGLLPDYDKDLQLKLGNYLLLPSKNN